MPRKPRIDLAGYHHVVNRGVNRSTVFVDNEDYEMFLKIVCKACRAYKVVLHDYCLMSNHFHLLVETQRENLSSFMKQINGNYAIYANKKQKRAGHFWQGRYYSRYINNDEYYYTLIRYIEQNPVEAGLVKEVAEYPYTLGSVIANGVTPAPCCSHSKLLEELDYENVQEMIGIKLNDEELATLEKIKHQKIIQKESVNRQAYAKSLEVHFEGFKTKAERNAMMLEALEDGYTQIEVANHLGVSRSLVSKVVRERMG